MMQAYELIAMMQEGMKRMSELGIKMEDYKYLPMCMEYNELVVKKAKKQYITAKLAHKYKVGERTVFRIIKRMTKRVRV